MINIKLGADPETVLKLGDKFISAHGIIPGTKDKPYKVDKGAIQLDGTGAEFNIDPASTAEEFDKNIEIVLIQMKEIVNKTDKDIKIEFKPFVEFEQNYWNTLPESVKILGCDPDFDYTGNLIQKDTDVLKDFPARTYAGHIHIGFCEGENIHSPAHFEDCRFVAKHFYNRGYQPYPSLGMTTIDESKRLKYYGDRGAFRPKPYGVELRQYSNVWVDGSKKLRQNVFNFVKSELLALVK